MFCFHKGFMDFLRLGFTLTLPLPERERRNPFYKGDDIGRNPSDAIKRAKIRKMD
jgi:hypothetical protein